MSIKQGGFLKELRLEKGISQEKLAEEIGLSRQSISKWEQGVSTPDIENLKKLSTYFGVSVDALIDGEKDAEKIVQTTQSEKENDNESNNDFENEKEVKIAKEKRHWIFASYPIIAVIVFLVIGSVFGGTGWKLGWTVLLTIPLFYTGIIAWEKKKPIIFCYPVLVLMIFMLVGLGLNIWHPTWIIFLTIPLFYIITARMKK